MGSFAESGEESGDVVIEVGDVRESCNGTEPLLRRNFKASRSRPVRETKEERKNGRICWTKTVTLPSVHVPSTFERSTVEDFGEAIEQNGPSSDVHEKDSSKSQSWELRQSGKPSSLVVGRSISPRLKEYTRTPKAGDGLQERETHSCHIA